RMDVAGDRALLTGLSHYLGVGRKHTACGCLSVGSVSRQQYVISQAEQPDVTPQAGMELLIVEYQQSAGGHRIGPPREIADRGNPASLVPDQVLDHVQVFPLGHGSEPARLASIVTAVVHVHMEIA